MEIISGFEKKLIKNYDRYIVALSGGSDSMCLIHNMIILQKKMNFELYAIHINHGIRGEEAKRDEKFVQDFCKNNNIDLKIVYVDSIQYSKDNHKTLEEAARILRYKEFEKYQMELNAKIVLAHHKKDHVETIIHNIVRGSGIRGLVGIENENSNIIRPMLYISKFIIDDYIKNNNINFVNDSTNEDINYTRNYIRKVVINDLEKINDKAIDHIADLSFDAKEADEYFSDLSNYLLQEMMLDFVDDKLLVIDVKKFNEQKNIVKIYLLKKIFEKLGISKKDITRKHLNDIISISKKEKGAHLDLPYNLTFDKKKQKIYFNVNQINVSMNRKNNK